MEEPTQALFSTGTIYLVPLQRACRSLTSLRAGFGSSGEGCRFITATARGCSPSFTPGFKTAGRTHPAVTSTSGLCFCVPVNRFSNCLSLSCLSVKDIGEPESVFVGVFPSTLRAAPVVLFELPPMEFLLSPLVSCVSLVSLCAPFFGVTFSVLGPVSQLVSQSPVSPVVSLIVLGSPQPSRFSHLGTYLGREYDTKGAALGASSLRTFLARDLSCRKSSRLASSRSALSEYSHSVSSANFSSFSMSFAVVFIVACKRKSACGAVDSYNRLRTMTIEKT